MRKGALRIELGLVRYCIYCLVEMGHISILTVFNLTLCVISGSLGQLITERGRLPEDLSLHYQSQVLVALEYLLKKKVVHLDIKGMLNKRMVLQFPFCIFITKYEQWCQEEN